MSCTSPNCNNGCGCNGGCPPVTPPTPPTPPACVGTTCEEIYDGKCVIYTGPTLTCFGIQTGNNLNAIVQLLSTKICTVVQNYEATASATVYYWQLANVQDDIDQVVPLITPSYLSAKPSLPYAQFNEGEVVAYTQIGRIVFVIASTQAVTFAITDPLNNDVTDEFDKDVSIANTVIYVSKNPYSNSSMYFNFKNIS